MKIVNFYRVLLLVPIVTPLALLAVARGLPGYPSFTLIAATAGFSLLIGGIPYVLIAIGVALWIRGRDERAIRRVMFICPLLMVPLLGVGTIAFSLVNHEPLAEFAKACAFYSCWSIGLGYIYVGLAVILIFIARRSGYLIDEPGRSVA